MTDRLPEPVQEAQHALLVERASATPDTRPVPRREQAHPSTDTERPAATVPAGLSSIEAWVLDAICGAEPDPAAVAAVLTDGPRSAARDRLEIYRYGYTERLVECLLDDYPVLARTLGAAGFRALAEAYIERHPSRSPNLNAFGRHMAAFCEEAGPDVLPEPRAFFSDLTALEWALVDAIHAASGPELTLAALQAVPQERWGAARLVPSPTVRVLRFSYPVNAFFTKCREAGEPPPIPARAPTSVAVYRHAHVLWRMELTPAMARVLVALLEGRPIGEALSQMAVDESDPGAVAEAERSVMFWFREWASSGFFAGIRVAP